MFEHLADESLERNKGDVAKALAWKFKGLQSDLHHHVVAMTKSAQPNYASLDTAAQFGCDAIKDIHSLLAIAEKGGPDMVRDTFSRIQDIGQYYYDRLGPTGESEWQMRFAGAIGEWATAKALQDGCLIDTSFSTPKEDITNAKVDLWAMPGTSEYDGFQSSEEVWGMQVKVAPVLRPQLFPIEWAQIYASQMRGRDQQRILAAARSLSQLPRQYDNVQPFILLAPNLFNNQQNCYDEFGNPTDTFVNSIEKQISDLAEDPMRGRQFPVAV